MPVERVSVESVRHEALQTGFAVYGVVYSQDMELQLVL